MLRPPLALGSIGRILKRLLSEDGSLEPRIVNNLEWFGPMPLLSFLRDIGKFARRAHLPPLSS